MNRLLYVTASPQSPTASFSRRVSDAFVGAYREKHPEDEIDTLDLWTETLPAFGPVASAWKVHTLLGEDPTPEELAERSVVEASTHRFLAADKYVFSVPMWNFSVPYKFKHYLDVIVQPRMTFDLDPAVGFVGLVPSTRPVQLILARGGAYAPGTPAAVMDHQLPYLRMILGFIGLTDVRVQVLDCTAYPHAISDPMAAAALQQALTDGAIF